MTDTTDARKFPRGRPEEGLAWGDMATDLTSRGLSDLAARAIARLRQDTHAGDLSEEAKACMQSPVATALARALCDDWSDTADLMVADLLDAGITVEDVCLDHLAPAARCLGEWWESDRLPFTEVALATARIQAMLRRMPIGTGPLVTSDGKGAVFCAVPGEQHTLGVMMAADLFRRNGWDVSLLMGLDHAEIMERLDRDDRGVIGLSCSGAHSVDALARLMSDLRRNRPDARILLSGQIVLDRPALEKLPRADAVVGSMSEAEHHMARFGAEVAPPRQRRVSVA